MLAARLGRSFPNLNIYTTLTLLIEYFLNLKRVAMSIESAGIGAEVQANVEQSAGTIAVALLVEGFDPVVEEIGTVVGQTLGYRGWERDNGFRYERGDGK